MRPSNTAFRRARQQPGARAGQRHNFAGGPRRRAAVWLGRWEGEEGLDEVIRRRDAVLGGVGHLDDGAREGTVGAGVGEVDQGRVFHLVAV